VLKNKKLRLVREEGVLILFQMRTLFRKRLIEVKTQGLNVGPIDIG